MNPERWQQIDRILEATLELPADERSDDANIFFWFTE